MGGNNQRHRTDRKRRADRQSSGSGARGAGPSQGSSGPNRDTPGNEAAWQIESLTVGGARAAAAGWHEEVDLACTSLARYGEVLGRRVLTGNVGRVFCTVLASLWESGWQPLEVARYVKRRRRGRHGQVISAAMGAAQCWEQAAGAVMPEAWATQVRGVAGEGSTRSSQDWLDDWVLRSGSALSDALRVVIETLGLLVPLPVIEVLLPKPSEWAGFNPALGGRAVDDQVLAKIRALLAKAESTGFEAESEALTSKAQELMARHAIDDALARAQRSSDELPIARRLAVDDPYSAAKSRLLQVVANANGVRAIWYQEFAMMAVVGFAPDLDAVEMLFTSLLVQGSKAMLARGSVSDGRGRSRTRSFRQSFLLAFAGRIRERLAVASMSARQDAEAELGTSLLPVLAGRDHEVDEAVDNLFPRLVKAAGPTATNQAGWLAGRTAAELANLGPDQGMLDGMVHAS